MKRNILEIAASIILGIIAFYLYIYFLEFMSTKTSKAFYYLTSILNQNLKMIMFWPFFVISDLVLSVPIFLSVGLFLSFIIEDFSLNRPFIVFCSFLLMFFMENIPFSSPFLVELFRYFAIFLLIVFFMKWGLSFKYRRRRLDFTTQLNIMQKGDVNYYVNRKNRI